MPKRCVVGGCSNTTKEGFGVHTFPKDEKTRRIWTRFVQTTRADFQQATSSSVICSGHFTEDCYDPSYRIKESLGIKGKKTLLPGKYPTIKVVQPRGLDKNEGSQIDNQGVGPNTSSSTSTTQATSKSYVVSGKKRTPGLRVKSNEQEQPGPSKRKRISSERRSQKKMIEEIVAAYSEEQQRRQELEVATPEVPVEESEEPSPSSKSVQTIVTVLPERVKKRSRRIQCYPTGSQKETQTEFEGTLGRSLVLVETEVQCSLLPSHQEDILVPEPGAPVLPAEENADDGNADRDEDYVPSDHTPSSDSEINSSDTEDRKTILEEDKFIVFRSCLLSLFTLCIKCFHSTEAVISSVIGTMIVVKQSCTLCSWERVWNSQPLINNTPAGNFLLSGAILFAGASPTKTFRVLRHMGCKTHHIRTFFNHQTEFLMPSIVKVWETAQHTLISKLMAMDKPLILGGDARADSPGHTAKFGNYTLMELNLNQILDITLIQKNEVTSSNAMELEGFKRTMKWMIDTSVMAALEIDCIITDRHLQVAKWIRENLLQYNIKHYYDVWHIAKSVKKKIVALGKKKECEVVNDWCKSIINHLHWAASSTPDGNQDLILEKFLSILNHVQNIHQNHDGDLFKECAHPPLEGERPRKWITSGSEACERLSEVLSSTRLKNDVKKMSPKKQTSRLEAFHSLINYFAPKLTVFSYEGMTCRLLLAALHYNENSNRDQAVTKSGEQLFGIDFPRAKQGDYTLREIPSPVTFGYVNDLMEQAIYSLEQKINLRQEISGLSNVPPPLTSSYRRPGLEEAVRRQSSRFAPSEASAVPEVLHTDADLSDEGL